MGLLQKGARALVPLAEKYIPSSGKTSLRSFFKPRRTGQNVDGITAHSRSLVFKIVNCACLEI